MADQGREEIPPKLTERDRATWAEVVVDVRVAEVDHPFHYRIPAFLQTKLRVGHRVYVPFGPRQRVEGFVVGLTSDAPDVVRPRDIIELVEEEPAFTEAEVAVAEWMAERYLCLRVQALQCFLPPGSSRRRRRPVQERTVQGVSLAIPPDEARRIADGLEKRAPRQAEVLRRLLHADGPIPAAQMAVSAGYGPLRALEGKGYLRYETVRRLRLPGVQNMPGTAAERPVLTPDQQRAVDAVVAALDKRSFTSILLHGVTGSGKTEVYLQAIGEAIQRGRQAIVLVPEISLTPQTVDRFRKRFGDKVAVLHSALGSGERYDEWQRIRSGEVDVVIGARSAIFAPAGRLGLIIIDEEHEASYKQEEAPRYHAREVAEQRLRMQSLGGVLLLGSATPSLETYHMVRSKRIDYVVLPERIGGRSLPATEIVDMREELLAGNRTMFSRSLTAALHEALARREQAILLLNRRGYASFLLCRECGAVPRCHACEVSLTYHQQPLRLCCHYCGYETSVLTACPQCKGPYLRPFGAGTQRVELEVSKAFPAARVLRMDRDTTARKGAHYDILRRFAAGEADILIGTQMIAKGHDFPGVTVVGVLNADIALHFPDFRAAERTFQLLAQVAGRAGRGDTAGRVFLQTYSPDHYAIRAAAAHDYVGFASQELEYRQQTSYPPYAELARILVWGEDQHKVASTAKQAAKGCMSVLNSPEQLVGPSAAPLEKLKGKHRWHLLIKGDTDTVRKGAEAGLQAVAQRDAEVAVAVDIGAVSLL